MPKISITPASWPRSIRCSRLMQKAGRKANASATTLFERAPLRRAAMALTSTPMFGRISQNSRLASSRRAHSREGGNPGPIALPEKFALGPRFRGDERFFGGLVLVEDEH